jgi:ATP-dependent Clp protease ATP-binding subunit ClpC
MFERFTDHAKKVLAPANEEVLRLNHDHVGTEHLLLGLLSEPAGVAALVLTNLGLNFDSVRKEIKDLLG